MSFEPPQQHFQPPPRPASPTVFNGATVHGLTGNSRLKHPADVPLFIIGAVIMVLSQLIWVVLGIALLVLAATDPENPLLTDEDALGLQMFIVIGAIPWVLWIARAMMYAQARAQGVRMSPTQFPEAYQMVCEAAQQFGMRRVPDAYVFSGNGMINAFAAGHGFRRYVVVYSDLFEVGATMRDPDAVRFVIAHEVGHHAAGHTGYFRLVLTNLMLSMPIIGPALSRAQEYSADNYGYSHCPQGAPGTMALLSAGKYLNAHVNVYELADRAATEQGFWLHLFNLRQSHPIVTWRTRALLDRSQAGPLFFRPSHPAFHSYLPPGSSGSERYPTPDDALYLIAHAQQTRPNGHIPQWGRYPGVDYSGEPTIRELQTTPANPPFMPPQPPPPQQPPHMWPQEGQQWQQQPPYPPDTQQPPQQ